MWWQLAILILALELTSRRPVRCHGLLNIFTVCIYKHNAYQVLRVNIIEIHITQNILRYKM